MRESWLNLGYEVVQMKMETEVWRCENALYDVRS